MTTDIDDRIASLLIRHVRDGTSSAFAQPQLDYLRDRSILRIYWSLTGRVFALFAHFYFNRHEAIPQRREALSVSDGLVRGRYSPTRSALLTATTGLSHRVVSLAPEPAYDSGANRIIQWTMRTAMSLLHEARSVFPATTPQAILTEQRTAVADPAMRLLASIMDSFGGRDTKPTPRDSANARRSRKKLYRLAANAFDLLERCEAGDADALREILTETVIGPANGWQRFELLAILSMADALALELNETVRLRLLVPGDGTPVALVGPYAIYWQTKTDLFTDPVEEPSERTARLLLESFGLRGTGDRPDVVVINTTGNTVAAICEAKYTDATDDTAAAFRQGIDQLVRYARGYEKSTPCAETLPRSLIAIKRKPEALLSALNVPAVADLEELLTDGALQGWARKLLK